MKVSAVKSLGCGDLFHGLELVSTRHHATNGEIPGFKEAILKRPELAAGGGIFNKATTS